MSSENPRAYPLSVERRRRYLFAKLPIKGLRVLELGALDMPTFDASETNIEFMDYYSDEEFAELASKGRLSRPIESLVHVSHVVKQKHFARRIGERFDLIIAAHVIEHIPDPLCWLAEISELLTPTGCVFLPIPDKRFTLDYLRRETSIFDLLRAFDQAVEDPSIYQVADFLYFKRSVRWTDVWAESAALPEILAKRECTVSQAIERAKLLIASGQSHVNVHCHVFSAPTFQELFHAVRETGVVPLDLLEVQDVMPNGNEFWALLRRQQAVDPAKRRPTKGRKFIVGRDEVLFLDNDTNETISQITGAAPLSHEALGKWRRLISSRRHLLADEGVKYKFIIAPAKEAVLSEYLPDGIQLSDLRPAIQVLNALPECVIYPLQPLRLLHATGELPYPRTETHWTDAGAIVVYRAILAGLGIREDAALGDDRFTCCEDEIAGDLGLHAGRSPERVNTLLISGPQHKITFDNHRANRGRHIVAENSSVATGSIMVFGDSFSMKLLPLLAETFSKLTFVWNPYVDFDLVEKQRPNYVINLMAERFLAVTPDDTHKFSWEEVALLERLRSS